MLNYLAVLVSAIAAMVIGAIWYSPKVFGAYWMRVSGQKTVNAAKKRGMWKFYLVQFISAVVMAFVLNALIGRLGLSSAADGIAIGIIVWLGFVATTTIGTILWEGKPFKLYVINNLEWLITLVVMGMILAIWP